MARRLMGMERLEDRVLLAGDVTVEVTRYGDLKVTGDEVGNDIDVRQLDGTTWSIIGFNGTRIIFRTPPENVTGHVIINMAGGDDTVHVFPLRTTGNLEIDLGDGVTRERAFVNVERIPDDVAIASVTGSDDGEVDVTPVADSIIIGELDITGRSGNNVIRVRDVRINERATINTDLGEDTVDLRNVATQQNLTVNTGGENDNVRLRNVTAQQKLTVNMGSGNDSARLENVTVQQDLTVNMDSGNDSVSLWNVTAQRDLTVNMGSGNDDVTAERVDVAETFKVDMGSGDDRALINLCKADTARLYGGTGEDTLLLGLNEFRRMIQRDWEHIHYISVIADPPVDGSSGPGPGNGVLTDKAFGKMASRGTTSEADVDKLLGNSRELEELGVSAGVIVDDLLPALVASPI